MRPALARVSAAVVGAVLAAIVITAATPASYRAEAALYVSVFPAGATAQGFSGDSSVVDNAVTAVSSAATSDVILAPTAAHAGLSLSGVRQMISARSVPDTTIVTITAVSARPDLSATVANTIASDVSTLFAGNTAVGSDRVTIVSTATAPTSAVPTSWPRVLVSGVVAGLLIALGSALAGAVAKRWRARPQPPSRQPSTGSRARVLL